MTPLILCWGFAPNWNSKRSILKGGREHKTWDHLCHITRSRELSTRVQAYEENVDFGSIFDIFQRGSPMKKRHFWVIFRKFLKGHPYEKPSKMSQTRQFFIG